MAVLAYQVDDHRDGIHLHQRQSCPLGGGQGAREIAIGHLAQAAPDAGHGDRVLLQQLDCGLVRICEPRCHGPRNGQCQRLATDERAFELRRKAVDIQQREVEPAGLQPKDQLIGRGRGDEERLARASPLPFRGKAGQHAGDVALVAERDDGAEPPGAGGLAEALVGGLRQAGPDAADAFGDRKGRDALRRAGDAAGRAVEQGKADGLFQPDELPGQLRLAELQRACGAADAAGMDRGTIAGERFQRDLRHGRGGAARRLRIGRAAGRPQARRGRVSAFLRRDEKQLLRRLGDLGKPFQPRLGFQRRNQHRAFAADERDGDRRFQAPQRRTGAGGRPALEPCRRAHAAGAQDGLDEAEGGEIHAVNPRCCPPSFGLRHLLYGYWDISDFSVLHRVGRTEERSCWRAPRPSI